MIKSKIQNLPKADWINKDILADIESRNEAWRKFKMDSNNSDLERDYARQKTVTATNVNKHKSIFYVNSFARCKNKPKKVWNLIHTLSNNKIKSNCMPPQLMTSIGLITDGTKICEYFN